MFAKKRWEIVHLAHQIPTSRMLRNLQYDMLGRWDDWLIDQASDVPSITFFIICYKFRALQNLHFNLCKNIENKKINWNDFCKEFRRKWCSKRIFFHNFFQNSSQKLFQMFKVLFFFIRHLVDVLYWRLSDFRCVASPEKWHSLLSPDRLKLF